VPVFFLMGLKDNLIRPANIMAHYATLSSAQPSLAFMKAFANASHVDFTIAVTDEIIAEILHVLECNPHQHTRMQAFTPRTS